MVAHDDRVVDDRVLFDVRADADHAVENLFCLDDRTLAYDRFIDFGVFDDRAWKVMGVSEDRAVLIVNIEGVSNRDFSQCQVGFIIG